jgi:hypothetical protein
MVTRVLTLLCCTTVLLCLFSVPATVAGGPPACPPPMCAPPPACGPGMPSPFSFCGGLLGGCCGTLLKIPSLIMAGLLAPPPIAPPACGPPPCPPPMCAPPPCGPRPITKCRVGSAPKRYPLRVATRQEQPRPSPRAQPRRPRFEPASARQAPARPMPTRTAEAEIEQPRVPDTPFLPFDAMACKAFRATTAKFPLRLVGGRLQAPDAPRVFGRFAGETGDGKKPLFGQYW